MQFDLRKFIATGTQPYHAEFPCDLSARDFAGARIEQPVTASFTAEQLAKGIVIKKGKKIYHKVTL